MSLTTTSRRCAGDVARPQGCRGEAGFALPMVLLATVAAFALGSAMVVSSLSATSGVERDTDTKSAFGVAEAGVSHALFRYNRFDTSSDPTRPCLAEGAGGQVLLAATEANGWCPAVDATAAGGQFSYAVLPADMTDEEPVMEIVATGYYDGLSRRIEVAADYTAQPGNSGVDPFSDLQLIGNSITIENGSTITADVGARDELTVGNGGKLHCEEVQATSPSFPKGPPCTVAAPTFDLPPVDNTAAKASNDNALLSAAGCQSWSGSVTKLLTIGCSYTLGTAGVTRDFYVCKLTLNSAAELTIPPGANVNIWFAPPEECGGNTVPYVGENGSKIRTAGSPASTLAFIVSDSPTRTTMDLSAGGNGVWPDCSDNFIIYAPTTDVSMSTASHICAGIAANSITTGPGSSITKTSLSSTWELPGSTGGSVSHFAATTFLECAPATATAATPDTGC